MVFRLTYAVVIGFLFLTACKTGLQSKDKVNAAVMDRLKNHSGLDLSTLDVTTTDVTFDKDKAIATVSFHPKGTSIHSGMTIKYSLEQKDGKWAVTGIHNPDGSAMATHAPNAPGTMGHGGAQGMGQGQLPPGHPSLPQKQ